ncbi:MAG TPA: hypothetical protein VFM14_18380 [Gemmatimonadales bacterium]|nr:hypothetical protein [Gemmatimonadales bacterium]
MSGRAFAAAAGLLLLAGACERRERAAAPEPPPTPPDAAVSAAPSPVQSFLGVWSVTGHHIPGTSALSAADAAKWHRRTVRLSEQRAVSEGKHCDNPDYRARTVGRDSLLGAEYHLAPGSLRPLASVDRLTLLEVQCSGADWAAMGGRIIAIDSNRVLAPWDGVFFELERARDFRTARQSGLAFVNRVWQVDPGSTVSPGELRVFLSEGTMVMASPNGTPALGKWRSADGKLVLTEEGHDYPTEIVEQSDSSFHIRIRGPGEPVELRMRPASPAFVR